MSAFWIYLAGLLFFLLIVDEPWRDRLAIATLWPLAMLILAVVVAILLLTVAVVAWPIALALVTALLLLAWLIA